MDTSHAPAAEHSAAPRFHALGLALLVAALVAGCKTDPTNPFLANEQPAHRAGSILDGGPVASEPLDPSHLENRDWIEQSPESYAKRGDHDRRWHYSRLDGYLHASAPRSDLSEALASTDPVVATNAAIVSAYWGQSDPTKHLVAAIRAPKLPLPLRCAAVEALGRVEQPAPGPALRGLLGDVETPDLHADLVRALARHAEPGDEKWFNAALAHRAWQVRLEGVAAWSALADLTLPDEAVELRRDPDPRVRATALRTIAAHRDPRAVGYLQEAIKDANLDVRVAATAGLREIGTADAKALLDRVKNRGDELQQAATLASGAAGGLRDDLQATAEDAQTQLRLAVSETLDQAEQRGREIAAESVATAHETVRQASAQAEGALGEAQAVAELATQRIREVQQLATSLREANLPEAARRQAAVALERLAMDANLEVRVRAARAMGEIADPSFLPPLMALLSDEADVQLAAMASLVQIAGSDVATLADGRPQTNDDKVRAWQHWYRERQNGPGR